MRAKALEIASIEAGISSLLLATKISLISKILKILIISYLQFSSMSQIFASKVTTEIKWIWITLNTYRCCSWYFVFHFLCKRWHQLWSILFIWISLMGLSDVNPNSAFTMLSMSVRQHFVRSILIFCIRLAIVWVMVGFSFWVLIWGGCRGWELD